LEGGRIFARYEKRKPIMAGFFHLLFGERNILHPGTRSPPQLAEFAKSENI